jgi:hypothetical protein
MSMCDECGGAAPHGRLYCHKCAPVSPSLEGAKLNAPKPPKCDDTCPKCGGSGVKPVVGSQSRRQHIADTGMEQDCEVCRGMGKI